jgi:hypothetical protein
MVWGNARDIPGSGNFQTTESMAHRTNYEYVNEMVRSNTMHGLRSKYCMRDTNASMNLGERDGGQRKICLENLQ